MHKIVATFMVAMLAGGAVAGDEKTKPVFDTIDMYEEQQVEGWKVLVNKRLLAKEHAGLLDKTKRVLGEHLFAIVRVVPGEAVAKMRKIPVWVELDHPKHPCMCYHPSADWLRDNAMNPEKAGGVEIANAKNFLKWTIDQPWMVLHEMAHGYHHQVLTFEHKEVRECYTRAVESKSYESVLHIRGDKRKHYALNNDREYFAEATEAFFGTNDFFPFVRAELKMHDRAMYDLLGKLYGTK